MLDSGETLFLNEDLFKTLDDDQRPVVVYEWLTYLNQVLSATQQVKSRISSRALPVKITSVE